LSGPLETDTLPPKDHIIRIRLFFNRLLQAIFKQDATVFVAACCIKTEYETGYDFSLLPRNAHFEWTQLRHQTL